MSEPYLNEQLARALRTAAGHEDAGTRVRAESRARQWQETLKAVASGLVTVGSRTPVRGLPSWVTPEVIRGGFATGRAVAGGPLQDDEIELAARLDVPGQRRPLFNHYLTESGLAELIDLLDSGTYRIDVPENAALLVVAWLVRAEDDDAAVALVEHLAPFADRLRFLPRRAPTVLPAGDDIHRFSVADVRRSLVNRTAQREVETQREALTVWLPFSDRVLELWGSGDDLPQIDGDWLNSARLVLADYTTLSERHTLCTKHRKPKQNLAVLLAATREAVQEGVLTPRRSGLVRVVTRDMVAKRGKPRSAEALALRAALTSAVARPGHARLAEVAAERLVGLPQDEGLPHPETFCEPITEEEAERTGLPIGASMTPAVDRILSGALRAPVERLVVAGVVPSAEVLADLIPGISGNALAGRYPDWRLARLMGAVYRAFRLRRTLLLVNLERQVRIDELPWVQAVASYATAHDGVPASTFRRVATVAVDRFPGTIVPNPLISELESLATAAKLPAPLVPEIASDIFTGAFSETFCRAAAIAQRVVSGTVYGAYFGLGERDFEAARRSPRDFTSWCHTRAGATRTWSVAANGTILEQAQIITTHNLAVLVEAGIRPGWPWAELARRSFGTVQQLLETASIQPRPRATIKQAAFAWRQTLFYLAMAPAGSAAAFVRSARYQDSLSSPVRPALNRVLDGLDLVCLGGQFDSQGRSGDLDRFLGWTADGRHWIEPLLRR